MGNSLSDNIDVVIEDDIWLGADLPALAQRACGAVLTYLGLPGAEIVVLGCDDARIAGLNADFRGKPRPTNVLSWPSVEHQEHEPGQHPVVPDTEELGDIAIAYGVCAAEAAAQGKPFSEHVTHLLVHGSLHLAGYDHENDLDAALMESTECEILATLGIADPYR